MKVVIAGGGTAGHVFPAVALADRLVADHGAVVAFIGSSSGQEATLVPGAGYVFHGIAAAPLRREVSVASAKAPFVAAGSIASCRPFVTGADAVVGMGGYASVPAVLAARRAHVPVVLHEQNAVPGLANRVLARAGARRSALSFADAAARFPKRVAVAVTGNPVRARVRSVPSTRARARGRGVGGAGPRSGPADRRGVRREPGRAPRGPRRSPGRSRASPTDPTSSCWCSPGADKLDVVDRAGSATMPPSGAGARRTSTGWSSPTPSPTSSSPGRARRRIAEIDVSAGSRRS